VKAREPGLVPEPAPISFTGSNDELPLLENLGVPRDQFEAYREEVRRVNMIPIYVVKRPDVLLSCGLKACEAKYAKRSDRAFNMTFKKSIVIVILSAARAAQRDAKNLRGVAREVRIVELPGLVNDDIEQWFEQGHTVEDLKAKAAAAPVSAIDRAEGAADELRPAEKKAAHQEHQEAPADELDVLRLLDDEHRHDGPGLGEE